MDPLKQNPLEAVASIVAAVAAANGCTLSRPSGHPSARLPRVRGNKYLNTGHSCDVPAHATPRVRGKDRNAPCPCGSGIKAKRCRHAGVLARIVKHDHPALSMVSEPMTPADLDNANLALMEIACRISRTGVGLAANQIGWCKQAIFLLFGRTRGLEGPGLFMFNPEIVEASTTTVPDTEGCLSYPGVEATVERPEWIVVRWRDPLWRECQQRYTGFEARVICHEIDHLRGICRVGDHWRKTLENAQ